MKVVRGACVAVLLTSLVACTRTPNAFAAPRTTTISSTATTLLNSGFNGVALAAECGTPLNPTNLAALEALDQHTIRVTLCNPDAGLPSKLAFPTMGVQPAEHLDATDGAPLRSPVGTGPYRLADWKPGEEIVMTRFPQYWGDPAMAGTLRFQWRTDLSQGLQTIESGVVDGFVIDGEDAPDPADFVVMTERALNVVYLGLNRDLSPLDNDWVRRAIATAIDKQALVEEHFPPGASVANQFVPPEIFGYGEDVGVIEFDPEQARLSLDRAGLENGIEISLGYQSGPSPYLPDPVGVANDIQRQLGEVGIRVNLIEMESRDFLGAVDAGDVPMYLLGWQATHPDPASFLDFHFGPHASGQFGAHLPDLEETLAEANTSTDQTARADLYAHAARLINRYLPAIPIAHGGAQIGFKADIAGAHASPMGSESLATMNPANRETLVWIQPTEPASLYCADEFDRDAFRICGQMVDTLFRYGPDGVVPALVESYTATEDATIWTFNLREGVIFHDGSDLDANDVVQSFIAQWDAESSLHVGRTGAFVYFAILFGGFLNTPAG